MFFDQSSELRVSPSPRHRIEQPVPPAVSLARKRPVAKEEQRFAGSFDLIFDPFELGRVDVRGCAVDGDEPESVPRPRPVGILAIENAPPHGPVLFRAVGSTPAHSEFVIPDHPPRVCSFKHLERCTPFLRRCTAPNVPEMNGKLWLCFLYLSDRFPCNVPVRLRVADDRKLPRRIDER